MKRKIYHNPVLVDEVLKFLMPEKGGTFIDLTLGGGGHTEAILDKCSKGGKKCLIIGIDKDSEALEESKKRLKKYSKNLKFIKADFRDIDKILDGIKIKKVNGILIDLGVSSHQFDKAERGFSFKDESLNAPLDMRMDREQQFCAKDVISSYSKKQLSRVLREYGEERYYRKIVDEIIKSRRAKKITTTGDLLEIIKSVIPKRLQFRRKHFATNVFRAIRIEVNDELQALEEVLTKSIKFLNPGGKLLVISFHSLEDRMVKLIFKSYANENDLCVKILTKKPVTPSEKEIINNPRSRSSKLRVIEKSRYVKISQKY